MLTRLFVTSLDSLGPFTFAREALGEEVHSDWHQGQQAHHHVHQVKHCLVVQVAEGGDLKCNIFTLSEYQSVTKPTKVDLAGHPDVLCMGFI